MKQPEIRECPPDAAPSGEAVAPEMDLEESLLAELRAIRASRQAIQSWVRRLSAAPPAHAPRPSRYVCQPGKLRPVSASS